mmetsp:Transcript_14380/g.26133  ORF Transcript_14380/g.26133 Transcript_14380/m.26133 type:complete len:753 (+) Transcript_14380:98-2356(+)
MSRPTPTIAVPPPVTSSNSEDITSPLTQQPRASVNAGVHSMLAAAIGLTSLGAPSSPSKASPSPSRSGVKDFTTQASGGAVDVAGNGNASRVTRDTDKLSFMSNKINKPSPALSKVLKPVIKEMIATATLHPRPAAMVMMAPHLIRPPAHYHCHLNNRPPYPALRVAKAAARPSALKRPTPWSSIRPSPAGFDTRHMPFNPHSAPPFANAAIAMDRFSIGERIAAMDRAAAAAAFASRPSPYDPYYPPYASLPPLPTPHQTTPVPSNKNFPETLFDVISSEEHAHIISWLPHGEGFIIHDKQRFSSMMLPRYFDGAKFTSFTRRLKRWSFVRVPRGPELGAYYNKNFMRDQPELVQKMRYRMDGQFEDGKKKSEENEKLEEQIEKEVEVEGQGQESLPKSLHVQVHDEPIKPTSQEDSEKQVHHQQNHVLAAKIPSPKIKTTYLTIPQDGPMLPLPSTLPKRSTPSATHKKMNHVAASGLSETPRNHTAANAESSLLPRGYPTLVSPIYPNERRFVEAQRELLLARSMMSHEVADSVARSVPASTAGLRSTTLTRSSMANHPYYNNASTTAQRVLDLERANRITKAERALGLTSLSADHHRSSNITNPNRELTASNTLPLSRTHEEITNAAARGFQSRLVPPFIQLSERHPQGRSNNRGVGEEGSSTNPKRERWNMALPMSYNSREKVSRGKLNANDLCEARMTTGETRSGRGVGGGRPVMMSRKEEEDFAEYLFMKRGNSGKLQAPLAWNK